MSQIKHLEMKWNDGERRWREWMVERKNNWRERNENWRKKGARRWKDDGSLMVTFQRMDLEWVSLSHLLSHPLSLFSFILCSLTSRSCCGLSFLTTSLPGTSLTSKHFVFTSFPSMMNNSSSSFNSFLSVSLSFSFSHFFFFLSFLSCPFHLLLLIS